CLVAHDLGRADLAARRAEAEERGCFDPTAEHHWVAVRMAGESGAPGTATPAVLAEAAARDRSGTAADPTTLVLLSCARAAVELRAGRTDRARDELARAVDLARRTESTLALPEALARRITVTAREERAAACRGFEDFEECVGGTDLPRETTLKLLARAAVRAADGRAEDASAAA
ncbi:hypothetical protein, partial [Actinotalea ferrariae]|uniref:hypothetical protein n=1 Tax=Actinotalea ferrariae TaxID=1386098 RepID=UPI001C1E1296